MKIVLLLCFILTGSFSNAQFKTPASRFTFNYDFSKKANPVAKPSGLWELPKATFSLENINGKVYSLPADKMPCLVPDISKLIPIPNAKTYFTNSLMLNPYKKEELIPQQ